MESKSLHIIRDVADYILLLFPLIFVLVFFLGFTFGGTIPEAMNDTGSFAIWFLVISPIVVTICGIISIIASYKLKNMMHAGPIFLVGSILFVIDLCSGFEMILPTIYGLPIVIAFIICLYKRSKHADLQISKSPKLE